MKSEIFFWRLVGPVAPTGKAVVHWIGRINTIKSKNKIFVNTGPGQVKSEVHLTYRQVLKN